MWLAARGVLREIMGSQIVIGRRVGRLSLFLALIVARQIPSSRTYSGILARQD